ncbi:hypothetical protein EIP91_006401 [Steccherinum ochraceum]|uniref:Beta-lactamase-related domain-containing protein n=1 Tax=Steccherinum ochraceum TaxID=92696 RepID=A0A4R0R8G7_9APHY|nr:hypothetical protein EIP91_006401 [Steccherinum ochraceum]
MLLATKLVALLGAVPIMWASRTQTPFSNKLGVRTALTPELSQFIERLREEETVSGIAVGVVHDVSTEHGAWGQRAESGADRNTTTDTLFGIASCSKAFASTALGILMDDFVQGKNRTALPPSVTQFDWHTKIADLLQDDWKLMDAWTSEKANIRDVLSHVSGLFSHDHSYRPTDSPLDIVQRMRTLRSTFELREQWSYSNQFYMLAAEIISRFSCMSYVDFVQTRIFDLANMTSSTFSSRKAAKRGRFSQGWTGKGRLMPYWFAEDRMRLAAGPMGVISNVEDLTQWLKILLNHGTHPTSRTPIIPPAVLEAITTPHAIQFPKPLDAGLSIAGYGIGWSRMSYYGHEIIWHPGGVPGITSLLAWLPKEQIGLVVLVNASAKDKVTNAIAFRIAAELLGIKEENPPHLFADFTNQHSSHSSSPAASDTNATVLLSTTYAGTYSNPAYGTVTLCTSKSTIADCPAVLDAFTHIDSPSPSSSPNNLYASHPGIWGSHIRLSPLPGGHPGEFRAQFPYLFPYGHGENKTGFEMMEPGLSEATWRFVVGEDGAVVGIGHDRMSDLKSTRRRKGGDVKDTADVWWEPVRD